MQGHCIQKIRAKDANGWAYYFVLIEPFKQALLNRAIEIKQGSVNLEEYGRIIASCYGDVPSDDVTKFLKEKYGIVL